MMGISIGTGLTIIGLAFGGWAWVVGWGVSAIRREVESLRVAVEATAEAAGETAEGLTRHILVTEKRLTMLESEFGFLRRYLTKDPGAE